MGYMKCGMKCCCVLAVLVAMAYLAECQNGATEQSMAATPIGESEGLKTKAGVQFDATIWNGGSSSCSSHSACSTGICNLKHSKCLPCLGTSCGNGKLCWMGKCLTRKSGDTDGSQTRNDVGLTCGTCQSGYVCRTVTDMWMSGKLCVPDCPEGKTGYPSCSTNCYIKEGIPTASGCHNGDRFQSTHCPADSVLVPSHDPGTGSYLQECLRTVVGSHLVGSAGGDCSYGKDTTDRNSGYCSVSIPSAPDNAGTLWVDGPVSGQNMCIRPECKMLKRVYCGNDGICFNAKIIKNTHNECQWSGCSEYAGTAADREPNDAFCTNFCLMR